MNRRRRRTFRNILDRSPYATEDDAARSQERLEINDAEQRTYNVASEPKRDASRGESAKDVLTNGDPDKRSDGGGLGGAAAAGSLDGTKCAPTGAAPHATQNARTPHGAPVEMEAQVRAGRSNPSESHSTSH